MQKALEPTASKAFMVDDQGLEGRDTSLKPSKERRFGDIIFVQYSKNTQKQHLVCILQRCKISVSDQNSETFYVQRVWYY